MKKYSKIIITLLIVFVIGIGGLFYSVDFKESKLSLVNSNNLLSGSNDDVIYMSDLDYITDNNWSYNGWSGHSIQKDKNPEGNTISLLVNSKKNIFIKGMGVHANGQVTYDISDISSSYTRFISEVGVDSSRGVNGSVKFKFSVSLDGESWNELLTTDILKGNTDSYHVDLDISNYKYFRVYVDRSINGNTADHGVIAPAKFVKSDYIDSGVIEYSKLKELSYYDDILNDKDYLYNINNNYELILKREIVRKLGYDEIQSLINYSSVYQDFFDWVLSDTNRMEQVIEVGEVNRIPFVKVLNDLYQNNKNNLTKEDGDTYQRMMIGLAAAYSTDKVSSALAFSHKDADYDYLERFQIYKKLFDDGNMTIYKNYFRNYHVELMRAVMSDGARNDEVNWLNYYTRSKDNNQSVYAYVNHTYTGVGYNDEEFYDINNKDNFDSIYKLSDYGVPFGDNIQRYWMVIKKGGICWNQSRVFQSLFNSIGSPTIGVYQPAHEAVLYYLANPNGTGSWNMANKIFKWGQTGTTWYGGNRFRTIFDWSNKSFTNQPITGNAAGNSGAYIYLAQDNLNNYDKYKKSLYLNLLANSYSDNNTKVSIYNNSLNEMNINLDTYDYLIKTYKQMDSITGDDWYNLSLKIIDNYTYYPMAMNDLLKVIKPYLENEKRLDIDNKEYKALVKASKATSSNVSNYNASKEVAEVLLGSTDGNIATFSFDGENKNKIMLNDMYKSYDISWHYSIDGGVTKSSSILDKSYLLSDDEVSRITDTNDILIYIDGLDINTAFYTIDITKKDAPTLLYNNDLENKVMGVTDTMQWRIKGTDNWTSYKDELPDLSGDKTVQVRFSANSTYLASDYVSLDFTKDIIDLTKKYIPISYLSIHDVSTEAVANQGSAINAIDGNYNTRWHSAWNGTDDKRFITIRLSTPVHLSQIEYVPAGGGNGKIIDGKIEGSMDGENWFVLSEVNNLTYTSNVNEINHGKQNMKTFVTDSTNEVQYVRITAVKASNGNWFTARMFNFYQDSTKKEAPSAGVRYSINTLTNKDVVATLVDYDQKNIEILSGSDTHTFTENGEYSFVIRDKFTYNESTIVAKVDWIDKEKPVGSIKYNTTKLTNKNVIATLTTNEKVTILNDSDFSIKDGKVVNSSGEVMNDFTVDKDMNVYDKNKNFITNIDPFKHVFVENGEYTFEYVDEAGNKGVSTAKVNWIDKKTPNATLSYDIKTKTSKNVTVKISFDKKNVTILNNKGKNYYTFTKNGEYTFEYVDEAGNHGSITAKVNWIDKKMNSNNKGQSNNNQSNKNNNSNTNNNNSNDNNKSDINDNSNDKEDKKDDGSNDIIDSKDDDNKKDNIKDNDVVERKEDIFNIIPYVVGISLVIVVSWIIIKVRKRD